jgi:hypothetical protein
MHDRKSLFSCTKCLALRLCSREVVVRGAAADLLSGQAARCRMAATQTQCEVLEA